MLYKTIQLNNIDAVCIITLKKVSDLPEVVGLMASEIRIACDSIKDDPNIKVVIVTGSGQAFCLDTQCLLKYVSCDWPRISLGKIELPRIAASIAQLELPVIAAIDGKAHGIGFELALACDIRIASDTTSFCMDQIFYGMMPWDGGTQRLPRLIGRSRAISMLFTGEVISSQQGLREGLIHGVYPPERLADEALYLAQRITSYAPIALKFAKETINKGMDMTLDQGLRLEQDLTVILQSTHDRAEGIESFLKKRMAKFKGA